MLTNIAIGVIGLFVGWYAKTWAVKADIKKRIHDCENGHNNNHTRGYCAALNDLYEDI